RDPALPAAGDEALRAGGLDLLLLQLEDAVAQWRRALVRHHAAAAATAESADAVRLEFDQPEAERRQDAARRGFEAAAAHDLTGIVEGRGVADLLHADPARRDQLVHEL